MAGFDLQLKLEGLEPMLVRLKAPVVAKTSRHMIEMATLIALAEAKEQAPVRSNVLRGSITHSLISDFSGKIGTNVEYAKYQEFGTGIYGPKGKMITPKRGKFLVFKGSSGKMIFARQVRGSKPKQFMKKGLQRVVASLDSIKAAGFTEIKRLTKL